MLPRMFTREFFACTRVRTAAPLWSAASERRVKTMGQTREPRSPSQTRPADASPGGCNLEFEKCIPVAPAHGRGNSKVLCVIRRSWSRTRFPAGESETRFVKNITGARWPAPLWLRLRGSRATSSHYRRGENFLLTYPPIATPSEYPAMQASRVCRPSRLETKAHSRAAADTLVNVRGARASRGGIVCPTPAGSANSS